MLGQLSRQDEADSSLDLSTGDCGSLVIVSQTGGLSSDSLKDIIDEAVHDAHGFARDTSVWVHLLQHLVYVDAIAFLPLPFLLLVSGAGSLGLSCLLRSFAANLGWHVYDITV